ncbi:putative low temperature-induced protein|uniref:Dps family protein n=1 Tax=Neochlamydia sp. AcF84 TaxID=2315858 RepID=UPI00140807FF|nr:DNA starvation/stationary phase protection protein [Neochlamydia sp. AcF84]NGY94190.1 putative low temperature-induced protein [Neochlamydia sp. AcF84]
MKNTYNPAPSTLAVSTHLQTEASHKISQVLNPLIADAFALYVKTKSYHWHMFGPHFRDYHLLMDEQAEQIFTMIDVLAERVRKLGALTIHSIKQISQLQNVQDDDEPSVEAIQMLKRLEEENRNLAARMLAAHKVCQEYQDVATTSILEVYIDEAERRAWFLFETQQS